MSAPLCLPTFSRLKYCYTISRLLTPTFFHTSTCLNKKKKRKYKQQYINDGIIEKSQDNVSATKNRVTSKYLHVSDSAKSPFRQLLYKRFKDVENSILVQRKAQIDINAVLQAINQKCGNISKVCVFENHQYSFLLVDMEKNVALPKVTIDSDLVSTRDKTEHQPFPQEKISTYSPKVLNMKHMNDCDNLSAQIRYLYNNIQMAEEMIRCHFLVCSLVEDIIRKDDALGDIKSVVLPFGSVPCGLAMEGVSDLDMVLMQNAYCGENQSNVILLHIKRMFSKVSSFAKVQHIPARVPIVTFKENTTKMSCDLSYGKLSGLQVAEIFCWLHTFDNRFYPLVLTIKYLVKKHRLLRPQPCSCLSSFMITVLVVAYLQKESILPPLHMLNTSTDLWKKAASPLDIWESIELQSVIPSPQTSDDDLGFLLVGFFKFYSEFPFSDVYIDLISGQTVNCTHGYKMCVLNPHERGHNIFRNVKKFYVDEFQQFCTEVVDMLSKQRQNCTSDWGLSSVINTARQTLDVEFIYADDELQELVFEVGDDVEVKQETMDKDNKDSGKETNAKIINDGDMVTENSSSKDSASLKNKEDIVYNIYRKDGVTDQDILSHNNKEPVKNRKSNRMLDIYTLFGDDAGKKGKETKRKSSLNIGDVMKTMKSKKGKIRHQVKDMVKTRKKGRDS